MFDAISLVINIGVIGYLIYSIFTGGLPSLGSNYIFLGYLIFTTLTLPNLLSKVIFKSRLFGVSSALLFVYYPIIFLLQVFVAYITGLSLNEVLPFGVIFNLILWNILLMLFIIGDNKSKNESEKLLREIFSAILPATIFVVFVLIFIRQRDSVVALDYLQHITVPNRMFQNSILCFLPGQCSNLFLQHGYTTFYHIILGNITSFIGADPIRSFYVLDAVFPLVVSIPIYMIFKRVTRSTLWSQLGVLLTLLTFVMGGYDFVFFIPQTFALYIFVLSFKEKNVSVLELILISTLLLSVHFIMGALFVGYLWFRYLIIQKLKSNKEKTILLLLLALSVLFFILANISGFSVEKLIQQEAIQIVGSLTNSYYPNNLRIYMQNLGAGWLLVLVSFLFVLLKKKKSETTLSIFAFISFGAIFFFLAPTYANKFPIGLGFFASLVVITHLWNLGFKPATKLLLFTLLIFIWGSNYYVQYDKYLGFYTQENGVVSAIVEEDKAVIEEIKMNNLTDTFMISDPYTQIVIAALANVETANAQYMHLETRSNLIEYLEKPNPETYETLLLSPGIPARTDVKILYSSRLERSIRLNDYSWLHNIYSLPINNSYHIVILDKNLLKDQRRLGNEINYISDNFILLK